jgi:hypothetical protein
MCLPRSSESAGHFAGHIRQKLIHQMCAKSAEGAYSRPQLDAGFGQYQGHGTVVSTSFEAGLCTSLELTAITT